MKERYRLYYAVACSIWKRSDLERKPKTMERIAGVLSFAGIDVHEIHTSWLECEPRPAGIWEALTGELAPPHWTETYDWPPEEPGYVLGLLADKGIPITSP